MSDATENELRLLIQELSKLHAKNRELEAQFLSISSELETERHRSQSRIEQLEASSSVWEAKAHELETALAEEKERHNATRLALFAKEGELEGLQAALTLAQRRSESEVMARLNRTLDHLAPQKTRTALPPASPAQSSPAAQGKQPPSTPLRSARDRSQGAASSSTSASSSALSTPIRGAGRAQRPPKTPQEVVAKAKALVEQKKAAKQVVDSPISVQSLESGVKRMSFVVPSAPSVSRALWQETLYPSSAVDLLLDD